MNSRASDDLPDPLPGLEQLDADQRRRVVECGRRVHIPPSWAPIHESVPADEAYLILEGTMRVDSGGEHLADIGPGDFAGEMGLVDHRLRSAQVTTLENVVALAFPSGAFATLRNDIAAFDEVVRNSTAARRLRA